MCAIAAKRVTIMPKDMYLARILRGECARPSFKRTTQLDKGSTAEDRKREAKEAAKEAAKAAAPKTGQKTPVPAQTTAAGARGVPSAESGGASGEGVTEGDPGGGQATGRQAEARQTVTGGENLERRIVLVQNPETGVTTGRLVQRRQS